MNKFLSLFPVQESVVNHMQWKSCLPLDVLIVCFFFFFFQVSLAFQKFFWFTCEYNGLLFAYTLIIMEFTEVFKGSLPRAFVIPLFETMFAQVLFHPFSHYLWFLQHCEISCTRPFLVQKCHASFWKAFLVISYLFSHLWERLLAFFLEAIQPPAGLVLGHQPDINPWPFVHSFAERTHTCSPCRCA